MPAFNLVAVDVTEDASLAAVQALRAALATIGGLD